jgi:translation initiation factor IF-3
MIRAREVRVIGQGEQLGIMAVQEAIQLVEEQGWTWLKLFQKQGRQYVVLWITANTSISKASAFSKPKETENYFVKEIKLRPKTEEHDYQFKTLRSPLSTRWT